MILKFDEYIKEGLWSKGVERSKSGEERLGDISNFDLYVKNIEWVDMGHPEYLFAEYDYPELSTIDEIDEIKSKLSNDIHIMNFDEEQWIENNCSSDERKSFFAYTNKKNGKSIMFNLSLFEKNTIMNMYYIDNYIKYGQHRCIGFTTAGNMHLAMINKKMFNIKLVKKI